MRKFLLLTLIPAGLAVSSILPGHAYATEHLARQQMTAVRHADYYYDHHHWQHRRWDNHHHQWRYYD